MEWKNYETGLTGNGPTLFDSRPDFKKPKVLGVIRNNLDKMWDLEKESRQVAWNKVCETI